MDRDEYTQWASRLRELSEHQRRDLTKRMSLLGIDMKSKDEKAMTLLSEDWLLDGIVSRLKSRGLMSHVAVAPLIRGRSYGYYRLHASALRDELDLLRSQRDYTQLSDVHARMLTAQLVADAIIKWLEKRKMAVTPAMVLSNTHHAIEALNACFPGYVSAGMFHVVLSRRPSE